MSSEYINLAKRPELAPSELVEKLPKACCDELAAVELIEDRRWDGNPCCPHCGDTSVYKMTDSKTGQRSSRFLWRCRGCKKQYTVRFGTVFEESLLPLRHWCYAFWRLSTSKKGVAAMEIQRQCQISYKSALFLMHRVRFAMTPTNQAKLNGIVECDETYCGGKPRPGTGPHKRGRGTKKTPVFGMVERGGKIHRRVVADVTGATLKGAMREMIHEDARVMTDENRAYLGVGPEFKGGHDTITHSAGEYARGDVNTNSIESSFALVKRGLTGIYHAVSKEHLHRYVSEFDFRWNARTMNDGERTALAIESAVGKRLLYRTPTEA